MIRIGLTPWIRIRVRIEVNAWLGSVLRAKRIRNTDFTGPLLPGSQILDAEFFEMLCTGTSSHLILL